MAGDTDTPDGLMEKAEGFIEGQRGTTSGGDGGGDGSGGDAGAEESIAEKAADAFWSEMEEKGLAPSQKADENNEGTEDEGTDAMPDDGSSDEGAESDAWVPYEGPQGGQGWQNPDTGDVVYDDEPPGGTPEGIPESLSELEEAISEGEVDPEDLADETSETTEETAEAMMDRIEDMTTDDPTGFEIDAVWDEFDVEGEPPSSDEIGDPLELADRVMDAKDLGARPEDLREDGPGGETGDALDQDEQPEPDDAFALGDEDDPTGDVPDGEGGDDGSDAVIGSDDPEDAYYDILGAANSLTLGDEYPRLNFTSLAANASGYGEYASGPYTPSEYREHLSGYGVSDDDIDDLFREAGIEEDDDSGDDGGDVDEKSHPVDETNQKARDFIEGQRGGSGNADSGTDPSPCSGAADEFRRRLSEKGVFGEKAWVPYTGPDGGEGWQNTENGDVQYTEEPPGPTPDPDDLSDEELQDFADSRGIDAGPDEVREALEEALAERGEGGDGGGGGESGGDTVDLEPATDSGQESIRHGTPAEYYDDAIDAAANDVFRDATEPGDTTASEQEVRDHIDNVADDLAAQSDYPREDIVEDLTREMGLEPADGGGGGESGGPGVGDTVTATNPMTGEEMEATIEDEPVVPRGSGSDEEQYPVEFENGDSGYVPVDEVDGGGGGGGGGGGMDPDEMEDALYELSEEDRDAAMEDVKDAISETATMETLEMFDPDAARDLEAMPGEPSQDDIQFYIDDALNHPGRGEIIPENTAGNSDVLDSLSDGGGSVSQAVESHVSSDSGNNGGGDGGGDSDGGGAASEIADNAGDELPMAWGAATMRPDSEMPDDPEEAARDIMENDMSMAMNYADDTDAQAHEDYLEYDQMAADQGATDEFMTALQDELEDEGVPAEGLMAGDWADAVQLAGSDAVNSAAERAGLADSDGGDGSDGGGPDVSQEQRESWDALSEDYSEDEILDAMHEPEKREFAEQQLEAAVGELGVGWLVDQAETMGVDSINDIPLEDIQDSPTPPEEYLRGGQVAEDLAQNADPGELNRFMYGWVGDGGIGHTFDSPEDAVDFDELPGGGVDQNADVSEKMWDEGRSFIERQRRRDRDDG